MKGSVMPRTDICCWRLASRYCWGFVLNLIRMNLTKTIKIVTREVVRIACLWLVLAVSCDWDSTVHIRASLAFFSLHWIFLIVWRHYSSVFSYIADCKWWLWTDFSLNSSACSVVIILPALSVRGGGQQNTTNPIQWHLKFSRRWRALQMETSCSSVTLAPPPPPHQKSTWRHNPNHQPRNVNWTNDFPAVEQEVWPRSCNFVLSLLNYLKYVEESHMNIHAALRGHGASHFSRRPWMK
jgi:hypothetical protein